tara:strand:+ start:280 stop:531 length:252 start_codon:yes stop_codon:yes gene_type:complete
MMTRDEWFALIKREDISLRFATEIESFFGEYPGIGIVEALWSSDWGRGVAEHFGIDHLRMPEQLRALLKQYHVSNSGDSSDSD